MTLWPTIWSNGQLPSAPYYLLLTMTSTVCLEQRGGGTLPQTAFDYLYPQQLSGAGLLEKKKKGLSDVEYLPESAYCCKSTERSAWKTQNELSAYMQPPHPQMAKQFKGPRTNAELQCATRPRHTAKLVRDLPTMHDHDTAAHQNDTAASKRGTRFVRWCIQRRHACVLHSR